MDQRKEDMCGGDCRCDGGSCGGGNCRCGGHAWGRGLPVHHILRWAIAIAIVAIVFKVGVAVGEFKTEVKGFSGGKGIMHYRSMMRGDFDDDADMFFFKRNPMMRGSILESVGTTTDPARR
ncbi:MAG: hypothetical protein AAB916_01850 [Patescibacteria group bacterium]